MELIPFYSPPQAPRKRLWRWITAAALLLLGGYLLFAHGCHGDEDNELFAGALVSAGTEPPASSCP
jgi:hypothetical protein